MQTDTASAANRSITKAQLIALLAVQCAVMIAAGLGLWTWSGRPARDIIGFSAGEWLGGLGLGAALSLAALALWRMFPRAAERLVRLQADTYAQLLPHISWPVIVAVSLCAGFGEEALFRAGLQTLLADHIGAPGAILLSAAVFAAIHFSKPVVTALIFAIGCLFGVVYWHTGSLLVVALGHAAYDVWALKYLHREFGRLGLADKDAPLVNTAEHG